MDSEVPKDEAPRRNGRNSKLKDELPNHRKRLSNDNVPPLTEPPLSIPPRLEIALPLVLVKLALERCHLLEAAWVELERQRLVEAVPTSRRSWMVGWERLRSGKAIRARM